MERRGMLSGFRARSPNDGLSRMNFSRHWSEIMHNTSMGDLSTHYPYIDQNLLRLNDR